MSRTSSVLLVSVLPSVLLVGLVLAVWGIHVPWYVLLIGVPVVLFGLMMLVGSIALAREEAALHRQAIQGARGAPPELPGPRSPTEKPEGEPPAQHGPDRPVPGELLQ